MASTNIIYMWDLNYLQQIWETFISDNVISSILSLFFHISNHGYHIVSLCIIASCYQLKWLKTVMNIVVNDEELDAFLTRTVKHACADVVH